MEIIIRSAHPRDLQQLIELQTLAIQVLCAEHYNPKQIDALVEDQRQARNSLQEIFWVAEYQQQIVGFVGLWGKQVAAAYVHPDLVGRGIGSQLLAVLEKDARQRRYGKLAVLSSLTAIPFYRAKGYRFVRDSGFYTRNRVWIPGAWMDKELVSTFGSALALSPEERANKDRQRWWMGILIVIFLISLTIALL